MVQVTQETTIMLDSVYHRINRIDTSKSKASSANIVLMQTQHDAQSQADAATCGARVFLCHIYDRGRRNHLAFSLPFNLLLEMAKLQNANPKRHKSNAEELINRFSCSRRR